MSLGVRSGRSGYGLSRSGYGLSRSFRTTTVSLNRARLPLGVDGITLLADGDFSALVRPPSGRFAPGLPVRAVVREIAGEAVFPGEKGKAWVGRFSPRFVAPLIDVAQLTYSIFHGFELGAYGGARPTSELELGAT
ncbi:MAG: hypothetical protein GY822_29645 [Deltaproteobacteria bacterium]|nr:hypothetical protein [Deltaproteobacteria bacterium]